MADNEAVKCPVNPRWLIRMLEVLPPGLRGRLGAMQKNVFDTNITTLGVALESISEARSEIIDTDFAAETAALTRAQILTQSGISVLAIANQNPSQVLALLG